MPSFLNGKACLNLGAMSAKYKSFVGGKNRKTTLANGVFLKSARSRICHAEKRAAIFHELIGEGVGRHLFQFGQMPRDERKMGGLVPLPAVGLGWKIRRVGL